jgi:hypothetical protein
MCLTTEEEESVGTSDVRAARARVHSNIFGRIARTSDTQPETDCATVVRSLGQLKR